MGKHINRLNIYCVQDHSFKRNASGDVGEGQGWEKAADRPVQCTHTYTFLHFAVQQKLAQHCKSPILQLKIFKIT